MRSFAVLLVALLVLAGGCGGGGDGEEPSAVTTPSGTTPSGASPSGTTRGQGTTPAAPPIPEVPSAGGEPRNERRSGAGEPSKGGEPAMRGSTRDSRRVERYLRDNFGSAEPKSDWYDNVIEISVSGAATTIKTDLRNSRAGRRQAREICMDVRGSIPGITDTVRVTELGARTLARCVP